MRQSPPRRTIWRGRRVNSLPGYAFAPTLFETDVDNQDIGAKASGDEFSTLPADGAETKDSALAQLQREAFKRLLLLSGDARGVR